MGDGNGIQPGCYYPGCEDRKAEGQKFCPKHYGNGWSAHAVGGVVVERKRGA